MTGYIFDNLIKIKKVKANKETKTPEKSLVIYCYRIKADKTLITITSLEDLNLQTGTQFDIDVSSFMINQKNQDNSDMIFVTGQVKSCREKPTKFNIHYVYFVKSVTINWTKITEVNMAIELSENDLDLLGSCYIELTNLHTIREELKQEDPNQKKLDQFIQQEN